MATLHASTYEHIQWSTIIQSRNKQCQWEMKPRFASAVHGDHRVVSTNPTREPPLILTQTLSTPTTSTLPKIIIIKKKTLKKNPALLTPAKTKTQHTFCPSSHHNEKVLLILLFLSLSQLLRHRQEACLLQKPHKDLCTPSLSNGFLNFTGHTCTKYKRFTFKRPLRQKNSTVQRL